MIINGEEVELVTSFDQLRAGMIVWVKSCLLCRRDHRCMVLMAGRAFNDLRGWSMAPSCIRTTAYVTTQTVEERRTYRVVDPKLSVTTARKREAVRT